ncbi:MAG: hypothetical protein RLZZ436_1150 [Planctomycetota bacterium]
MISFSHLGTMGRLGNQMFQYAFIRAMATRLAVTFWCPNWEGDEIFDLRDDSMRATDRPNLKAWYAPDSNCGWLQDWRPVDNVDYVGYFVSARYLPAQETVRGWFRFRERVVASALSRAMSIEFENSIALHVRLEDHTTLANYYNPRVEYYRESVEVLDPTGRMGIVVFSDEPIRAASFLRRLGRPFRVVSGGNAAEDIYLMSRCSAVVVAASSFRWWGGFLSGGRVICPAQGMLRPGASVTAEDPWPTDWLQLDAGLRWYDRAYIRHLMLKLRGVAGRLRRRVVIRRGAK